MFGATGVAVAAPNTFAIPLSTIGAAPKSGTLPDGVGWSVDKGAWSTDGQGYTIYPPASPQTYSFDRSVSLEFGISGLNLAGECVTLPVGTTAEAINANHTWNATTRTVCHESGASGSDTSTFTLADTTQLQLIVAGGGNGAGRGAEFINVADPPTLSPDVPVTAQDTPVTFDPLSNDVASSGGSFDPSAVELLDPNNAGAPTTTVTMPGEGSYVVNADNTVTFTPESGFTGTATPVTYQAVDSNGNSDTATITVSVAPVVGSPLANLTVSGIAALVLLAGIGLLAFRRRRRLG
jgi:CshA-type fibril repeat protein